MARVNVAMEIATGDVKFDKQKGNHTTINVLGLAYLTSGGASFGKVEMPLVVDPYAKNSV